MLHCSPETENARFSIFLNKIVGQEIQTQLLSKIEPAIVRERLKVLQNDLEWMQHVHQSCYDKKWFGIDCILDEVLFALETEGLIEKSYKEQLLEQFKAK